MVNVAYFLGYHCLTIALTVWALLKKKNPWPLFLIAAVVEAFAFFGTVAEDRLNGFPFPAGQLIGTVILLAVCGALIYFKHRAK